MVRRRRLPSPRPRPPRPGRAEGPGRIATARQGWAAATPSNFHQELEMAKSQRKGTKEDRKPKKAGPTKKNATNPPVKGPLSNLRSETRREGKEHVHTGET